MIMIESNTLALSKQYHRHRAALLQDKQKRYQQQWLIQVKKIVPPLATQYPAIERVYLFGSLLHPEQFSERSDIDLAIQCDDIVIETPFWRQLEQSLGRDIDLRPLDGIIKTIALTEGKLLYERQSFSAESTHSP